MKSFIITVDTEGDNLWAYHKGDSVSTENVKYIPRFQNLCNSYGFKPVWLTNYEMIMSEEFVRTMKPYVQKGLCEIGIHIHAWNNPPRYDLNGLYDGNPYLLEYPYEVKRDKFATTYNLIVKCLGVKPVSHRSGRWAMDDRYFKLLEEFGVIVDCSYTPGVSWLSAKGETVPGGSDYRKVPKGAHLVGNILELPATVRRYGHYVTKGSLKHQLRALIKGGVIWLRPALSPLFEMKKLMKDVDEEQGDDYLEFMIHSSELMPGGSPYFKDILSVDKMYETMNQVFTYARELAYEGETLKEYAIRYNKNYYG